MLLDWVVQRQKNCPVYIYFIYVQFKQTNIINTEIINTNTKLIQIQNFKLELLQSVYNCTWIWSKVKKKTCQGPSPRIYIKLCEVIEERNH